MPAEIGRMINGFQYFHRLHESCSHLPRRPHLTLVEEAGDVVANRQVFACLGAPSMRGRDGPRRRRVWNFDQRAEFLTVPGARFIGPLRMAGTRPRSKAHLVFAPKEAIGAWISLL
jgi:hypothetical protein